MKKTIFSEDGWCYDMRHAPTDCFLICGVVEGSEPRFAFHSPDGWWRIFGAESRKDDADFFCWRPMTFDFPTLAENHHILGQLGH